MTARDPDMTTPRGGAAVGMVGDLDPVAAAAVLYLRLWSEGPEGRARMARDMALALPEPGAARLCDRFGTLCDICLTHARRPLMRHALTCRCLGADESCFAHLVTAGSEAAREDAVLFAALLIRPDVAMGLAPLIEEVGLGLRRMTARLTDSDAPVPPLRRDLH